MLARPWLWPCPKESLRLVDPGGDGQNKQARVLSPRQDKGKGRARRTPSPEPVDPECIAPIMSEDEDVRGEEVEGGGHVDVSASVAHTRIPLHLSSSF